MKISKPLLVLSCAGFGLTFVHSQQSNSDAQTRAQEVLRQKMAELDGTGNRNAALPSRSQLLADIERMHRQGKISDEQFETFKRNLNEKYAASGGSSYNEAQAAALRALEQNAPAAPSNPAAQMKAAQALDAKMSELQTKKPEIAAPVRPDAASIAEQALQQKMAELNAGQETVAPPVAKTEVRKPEVVAEKQKAAAAAEKQKMAAEKERAAAEKQKAEAERQKAEAERQKAEAERQKAEAQRKRMAAEKPKVIKAVAEKPKEMPAPVSARPDASSIAEQVLHQKMAELNAGQIAVSEPSKPSVQVKARESKPAPEQPKEMARPVVARAEVRQPVQPAAPQRTARMEMKEEPKMNSTAAVAPLTPEQEAKARAALEAAYQQQGTRMPESASATQPREKVEPRAETVPTSAQPAVTQTVPAATPPVTFSTSNKTGLARLNELTELYKADKITPYEYHHERAKIVPSL